MRSWIAAVAACGLWSCSASDKSDKEATEAVPVAPAPLRLLDASAQRSTPAPPGHAAQAEDDAGVLVPTGWPRVTLEDKVPLCLFSSYEERGKAAFLPQVRKQTLRANTMLVLGAFPPGCINEACDASPTLQCWLEEEGSTIVVHSRMTSEHKPDSTCTKDCQIVAADCATSELKPGTYTIRHGDQSRTIRIPGVLKSPCMIPK